MSQAAPNIAEYTVSEISQAVKRTMEDTFSYVRVRGELGRVSRPASGHVYLDLKDEKAVLSGVIWRGVAAKLSIQPEQGLEVVVAGRITTFPGQSKYQIVIDTLEPAGLGALMALLEERKKKLAAEGLFAAERKQLLPYLPRVIGVVTSPTGAVIRDILHRLSDRFPTHVIVWPVRVQGDKSAEEVAAGIAGFNALPVDGPIPRPDLLIVARGGGSLEDLWSFNEETVVRAAADSDIPLISAVGHETDWTLIDYAADERAPTPTAAAERAVPVRGELIAQIDDLARRLRLAEMRGLDARRTALRSAERGLPRPAEILALPRQRLDAAAERLRQALTAPLKTGRTRLDGAAARLSPVHLMRLTGDARTRLQRASSDLGRGLAANATVHRAEWRRIGDRLDRRALDRRIAEGQEAVERAGVRLPEAYRVRLERLSERLSRAAGLLAAVSYQGVLERGFALVRDAESAPVRTRDAVFPGMALTLQFADGAVSATADGRAPEAAKKPGPKTARRSPAAKPKAQASLFDDPQQSD